MEAKPCIFCQIVKKQMPAKIVYEDENSIAFLDINPRSKGMAIVSPKKHYNDFYENLDASDKTFHSAMIVGEMIKLSLGARAVNFSAIESEAVPHFHVRVYPIYDKEMPIIENQPLQTNEAELNELAQKISAIKIETKEEVVEKKEEKCPHDANPDECPICSGKETLSEEDVRTIKRDMEIA